MNAFSVSPDKAARLEQRMAVAGVAEADLEESFVRSGGHGGQNVNKTSTCVMLQHRPTGIQVKCQETRQQGLNRFFPGKCCWTKSNTRPVKRGGVSKPAGKRYAASGFMRSDVCISVMLIRLRHVVCYGPATSSTSSSILTESARTPPLPAPCSVKPTNRTPITDFPPLKRKAIEEPHSMMLR